MCECAFTTHQYTHDCGWYKTEESWQPAEDCEDQCSCHTGQEGILGEVGGVSCQCLLCDWSRLGGNHLPLKCACVDGEEDGVCENKVKLMLPTIFLTHGVSWLWVVWHSHLRWWLGLACKGLQGYSLSVLSVGITLNEVVSVFHFLSVQSNLSASGKLKSRAAHWGVNLG